MGLSGSSGKHALELGGGLLVAARRAQCERKVGAGLEERRVDLQRLPQLLNGLVVPTPARSA